MRSLQGDGFWLSLTGDRLVFHLKASDDVRFGDGQELTLSKGDADFALPPGRCVSVTASRREDGGVSLAFGFRLAASEVAIRVGVDPYRIRQAEEFVGQLLTSYPTITLIDLIRQPRPAPGHGHGHGSEPEPDPRLREDWVSAPVSQETRDLYRAVIARLTTTDT